MSAQAQMLSYMEATALYNAINFNINGTDPTNNTVLNSTVNFFLCPSDGYAGPANNGGNNNSYAGSQGTTSQGNPGTSTGVFASQAVYGLRDIIDGSSNTIAYSEKLTGNPGRPNYRGNGVNGTSVVGYFDASLNYANTIADLQMCNSSFLSGSNIKTNIGQWWILGTETYSLFTTIVPPNSTQYFWGECRNGCGGCSPDSANYVNASSNHSGGANTLMGDGSVRFIKSSVNMGTYMALGTRSNGEVVDANSY